MILIMTQSLSNYNTTSIKRRKVSVNDLRIKLQIHDRNNNNKVDRLPTELLPPFHDQQ